LRGSQIGILCITNTQETGKAVWFCIANNGWDGTFNLPKEIQNRKTCLTHARPKKERKPTLSPLWHKRVMDNWQIGLIPNDVNMNAWGTELHLNALTVNLW
jgi:hypothetical protein